tara:strand:- start:7 stop:189 length:183 start_codon:yes stop_codon:yes gene_type:complete
MEIKKDFSDNILSLKKKKNKCPTCKKNSKEPFLPFCSKKCAEVDLTKWLLDEHETNTESS